MATRRGALSRLTLVLLAAALAACHLGQPGPKTADWSYSGANGPAFWPSLFQADCAGQAQSPIELCGAERAATLPTLHLDYHTVPTLTAIHSGHDVRVAVPSGGGTLRIGDDPTAWTLVEFHFHGPSEHTLRGTSYPLEIHLVHDWVESGITHKAVVGVFLAAGAANSELTKIWLPQQPGQRITATNFDLSQLLPDRRNSYRYTGSLTTPACNERVLWHVLAEPRTITPAQIRTFQAVFSGLSYPYGNQRPVQPINGRPVVTDVP